MSWSLIADGVVAVLLIGAVVIGYANFQNARPFRLESSTTLPPAEALNSLQSQMAKDGWSLGFREGNSLVMNITHPASFRKYLLDRLIRPTGIQRYHLLDGEDDVAAVC